MQVVIYADLETPESVAVSDEVSVTFASLLRELRRARMTQLQLQTALEDFNYTIDTTTLSKYESGERWPPAAFIPYFVAALGLSQQEENTLLAAYVRELEVSALEDYLRGKANVRH